MMDLDKYLRYSMEAEVIKSLLAGNDTYCFSTQQYEEARENWIARQVGCTRQELDIDPPSQTMTRTQLIVTEMVDEVSDDVWVLSIKGVHILWKPDHE